MTMYEKIDEIFAKMNKDEKMGENNFAKASLDELNEWKSVAEKVINREYDRNNTHHVDMTNKANRCLKRINEEIEKRDKVEKVEQPKKESNIDEKIRVLNEEVEKLKTKVNNLKDKLQKEQTSLNEYNGLVQNLVDDYKTLFDLANELFDSIKDKLNNISIDKRGDLTRISNSINSIKEDIVTLKNWLIESYNKKTSEYNSEFNDLKITEEEKKKYKLPSLFTKFEMIKRYDNEAFYKKLDVGKLIEAISNLNKIKAERASKKENTSEKTEEKKEEKKPVNEEKAPVKVSPTVSYVDAINSIVALNQDKEIYRDRDLNINSNSIYMYDDFNSLKLPNGFELYKSVDRTFIVNKDLGIKIGLYNARNYGMFIETQSIVNVGITKEGKEKKAKAEKKAIREKRKKLLVKKARSALNFYKKHRKFILYSAGLASITIAGLSVSSLIAPAIIFGNAIFINKESKYKPAIDIENEKLGNRTLSEEEVINNLNEATVECAKTKGEALGLKGKIISLGRKIKESISKINDNISRFNDNLMNNYTEEGMNAVMHR